MDHNKAFTDERGWPLWADKIKELLGIGAKAPLPPEGMDLREIKGYQVYVKPLGARTGFYLRVIAICPECNKHVAVGRMRQHKCKGERK